MKKLNKGYHITKKNKLYDIQKNGLEPRIGLRSNSIDEFKKRVYFSPTLFSMGVWKEKLYKKESFDNLAILSFELDGLQYENRDDSE